MVFSFKYIRNSLYALYIKNIYADTWSDKIIYRGSFAFLKNKLFSFGERLMGFLFFFPADDEFNGIRDLN